METKHSEGAGELRKIGRSCCGYICRKVWTSGECVTLLDGLCEEVPYPTTDEGGRDHQDLEGQESH
eukprot:4494111-Prorocentrum_lima.AAC.1